MYRLCLSAVRPRVRRGTCISTARGTHPPQRNQSWHEAGVPDDDRPAGGQYKRCFQISALQSTQTVRPRQQQKRPTNMCSDKISYGPQIVFYGVTFVFLGTVLASSAGVPLSNSQFLRYAAASSSRNTELADGNNDEDVRDGGAMVKRGPLSPGIWFGPRLGRRERRGALDENQQDGGDGGREDMSFVELLKDTPWALVALKGSRRHTVNFTPRLGRDSSEEDPQQDDPGSMFDARGSSPPFSPRLGRRLVPFSPRLGRERDVYTPRLGRSIPRAAGDNSSTI